MMNRTESVIGAYRKSFRNYIQAGDYNNAKLVLKKVDNYIEREKVSGNFPITQGDAILKSLYDWIDRKDKTNSRLLTQRLCNYLGKNKREAGLLAEREFEKALKSKNLSKREDHARMAEFYGKYSGKGTEIYEILLRNTDCLKKVKDSWNKLKIKSGLFNSSYGI